MHKLRYILGGLLFNQRICSHIWNKSRARVRNHPGVLISVERIWLHRRMHWNWSWRHWHCHRIRIRWWCNDNRVIHSSPWEHCPNSLLILNIKVVYIGFKRCLLFSEIIFLLCQLYFNKLCDCVPYQISTTEIIIQIIDTTHKKITSQDSSLSVACSAWSLLIWDVRSFTNWIVSARMVALSFLGLLGSAFQSHHMEVDFILIGKVHDCHIDRL